MGLLITIEGGEFVGKSSVAVPSLLTIFKAAGVQALSSREPGGTPKGEEIRGEIFKRLSEGATSSELAELFFRARKIHLEDVVFPYLGRSRENDKVLILDRYLDSSIVLQGMEGGVPTATLLQYINEYAFDFYPDLTIILYFPMEQFHSIFELRRSFAAGNGERSTNKWDEGESELQLLRQQYYCSLPKFYSDLGIPRKFVLVDASRHPREVIKDCMLACVTLLLENDISSHFSSVDDYLSLFSSMEKNGAWKSFDAIWREQQSMQL